MPAQRMQTVADAERQVSWRRCIGWVLIALSVGFLGLLIVKSGYILSYFHPEGVKLRNVIVSLLADWAVLRLLWRVIPPWQQAVTSPHILRHVVYAGWIVLSVIWVAQRLLQSAAARKAQIEKYKEERERDAWRQEDRAAQRLPPDTPSQYPAPHEPWGKTLGGTLLINLIPPFIVGVILLCVEYGYFQGR